MVLAVLPESKTLQRVQTHSGRKSKTRVKCSAIPSDQVPMSRAPSVTDCWPNDNRRHGTTCHQSQLGVDRPERGPSSDASGRALAPPTSRASGAIAAIDERDYAAHRDVRRDRV